MNEDVGVGTSGEERASFQKWSMVKHVHLARYYSSQLPTIGDTSLLQSLCSLVSTRTCGSVPAFGAVAITMALMPGMKES